MSAGHGLSQESGSKLPFWSLVDAERKAKAVGAVSVAVATGDYSVEQLRETGADHVLRNFAEDEFPGL